jgi:ribosome biogenesis GTPase
VNAGTLDPDRLDRWRKLADENRDNTPVATGPRGNKIQKPRGSRR